MSARAARGAAVAALALLASMGGTAVAAGRTPAVAAAAQGWTRALHSRPGLRIPRVIVTARDDGMAPGFMFLTPRTVFPGRTGPLILDGQGRVVWFHPQSYTRSSADLKPQVYGGKPVLTWSERPPLVNENDIYRGSAHNQYHVIADDSYRIIKRVRAVGRGVTTDVHEFRITSRNTALVLGYRTLSRRLSAYGGPKSGKILDCLVQEIDIRTNRVLFSWSAARHIPLDESMAAMPPSGSWDPYHLNSISEDADGNLLVSSRHTSTIYKIDRRTGRIIWKLGGRDSSFKMGRETSFYYQHDAERQPDGTLTLLDNHATDLDQSHGRESRALELRLDTKAKTATLVRSFRHPSQALATSQGSAEQLSGGNLFVGWGVSPWFSEYAADGRLLFAAHFTSVWHHSYRAVKADWTGHPGGSPAVAASVRTGRLVLYASWNGATDVAQWRVLGGPDESSLEPLGSGNWQDFETKLELPATPAVVQVEGLDAAGNVLGRSASVEPKR